jgi:DNA-binding HxlR family transcriptional regulator
MQLHKTQLSILHSLRYSQGARFNELMRPTEHTSDTFKFHLQKLVKLNYVAKRSDRSYSLTPSGKEFAENLDEQQRSEQKQPKLSVLIIASQQAADGQTLFLLQKRRRQPYYGFWNEITGPVRWGWSFEEAASKVLFKQTGLMADFRVMGMRRIRDFSAETGALLGDKLFIVVEASRLQGELANTYAGGINAWLSLDQLQIEPKHFASTPRIIRAYQNGSLYESNDFIYNMAEY